MVKSSSRNSIDKAGGSFRAIKVTNYNLVNGIYKQAVGAKFDLKPAALLVLIGLASHYNEEKKIVFPHQEYLAEHLNVHCRSVERAIKELLCKGLIVKSKRGTANVYGFTGIFFEAVKMCGNTRQIVGNKADNLSGTCHEHDNIKYINNSDFKNFKNEGIRPVSTEKTKKFIEEKKKIKCESPLDLPMESAIDMLKYLPPNSFFAKEIRKKWNLKNE